MVATISTHLRGELPHLRGGGESAMLPVYVGVGYINLYGEMHTHVTYMYTECIYIYVYIYMYIYIYL